MTRTRRDLLRALEADESGDLDAIIAQRRPEDFEVLRSLLTLDPAVKRSHRAKAIYALGGSCRRRGDTGPPSGSGRGRPHHGDRRPRSAGHRRRLGGILAYANDASVPVRKFVVRALARIDTPQPEPC